MYFRNEMISAVERLGPPTLQIDETRQLGAAYVGGMIDRMVEIDATFIHCPPDGAVQDRRVGGLIHSVEVPESPEEALKIHFAESIMMHNDFARLLRIPNPYVAGNRLPVSGRPVRARVSVLYAAYDGAVPVSVQTFFGTSRRGLGFDMVTAKSLTSVMATIIGTDLLARSPESGSVEYFLDHEDEEVVAGEVLREHASSFRL
jgi:hypothetical protein